MKKKTVSGSYDKYDTAYFGWLKFEIEPGKIEAVKKAVENRDTVLRVLLVSTVRENTYLGKRASLVAASFAGEPVDARMAQVSEEKAAPAPAAPASIEEMDKSIDEMVKEAI